MNVYIWNNAWDGVYGPRSAVAIAANIDDAEKAVKISLRKDFEGFKLGKIRKLGSPAHIIPVGYSKALGVTFNYEGDHHDTVGFFK